MNIHSTYFIQTRFIRDSRPWIFGSKNDFGLAATTDKDGLYVFDINFINHDHIGLSRPTIIPKEQYKFKDWYKQGKTFAITNGVWLGGIERLFDTGETGFVIVDKIFFD